MRKDQLEALFILADIQIKRATQIPNQYCPPPSKHFPDECPICKERPWWLVETSFGIVKIGWRKRVIEIDWSCTELHGELTNDQVTQSEVMVHAWGWPKALEYMRNLKRLSEQEVAI